MAKRPSITLTLEPEEAAALARLCEKFSHSDAKTYLYGHLEKAIREEQAYQMLYATSRISDALAKEGVRSWPWIETGRVTEEEVTP